MSYPDKIQLVLTYKHNLEDEEIFTERVDAERVGNHYRLVHIPTFAKNIAYGDVIKVEYDEGEYHFDELIKESGYSVVHIVIFKSGSKNELLDSLYQLNCGVNTHVAENYLVVSIPPTALYHTVQVYLQKEKASGNIDFRESCISRIHVQNDN